MKQTAFKVCLKYIFNDMVSLAGQLRVLKRRVNMSKGVPGDSVVKNLPAIEETQVRSLGQEDPWRREWLPTPGFLLGESCEHRSLASTIHGVAESDATKHAHQPLTLCLFAHLLPFLHHEFFAQSQGLRSSSSPPLQIWSLLKDFNTQLVACS